MFVTFFALFACGTKNNPDGSPPPEPGDTGRAEVSDDWCERAAAGGPSTRSMPLDLSAAHADIRFFGFASTFAEADGALVAAVDGASGAVDLAAYAEFAVETCALSAATLTLGTGSVRLEGEVAWVVPGTGALSLPDGARAVALDLRDLPEDGDLAAALARAASLALATPVDRGQLRQLHLAGLPDQVWGGTTYETKRENVLLEPITAAASAELPLAIVTGPRMAPSAADLAISLRLADRAWIVGHDLLAAVAEARWTPVGEQGLASRVGQRRTSAGETWPDLVPADIATDAPLLALAGLPTWGSPPSRSPGPSDRPNLPVRNDAVPYDTLLGPGEARAALLVAHGAARRFFPPSYWRTDAAELDEALLALLDEIDADAEADRSAARDRLRRLAHVLHDGHAFTYDFGPSSVVGYLAAVFEEIDHRPVVRRTIHAGLAPGDTIIEVDGQPIDAFVDDWLARVSAASDGYAFDLVFRQLMSMSGDRSLRVRDPDGVERDVVVSPAPLEDLTEILGWVPEDRESGWLDDLGAPTVYYLNMDGFVSTELSTVLTQLDEARAATGLIVDMRGYPSVNHYQVAPRLLAEPASSAWFGVPTWSGPDQLEIVQGRIEIAASDSAFTGPLVLLVGNHTVSAAENFLTILVNAGRPTAIVGRPSAGTNGNITGLQLPGGFGFCMTGMEVLFADGSPFQGVGIQPDIEVELKAADFRDQRDPELQAALALLAAD